MPGYGAFYWAERTAARRRPSYPAYRGDHEADVVVIGGGLTGCTAAYVLANAGLSVVLVEADRLATGATAAGAGAIVPEPDASFRAVEAQAGRRAARTAWAAARRSALDFAAALRRLRIRCDLEQAPLVINARTAADAEWLRREQAARRAGGVTSPWLTPAGARAEVGADSSGALRLVDAFTFDPVRAALGLGAAAAARGARVFEKSEVRRTRFTRRHADVILATGSIRTRGVFVATGGPGALFSSLRRHVHETDAYAVVTEPLTAAMRREAGRRASVTTEAGDNASWLRWLSDDRALVVGSRSKAVPPRQRDKALVAHTAQLMYEFSLRYPAISGLAAKWGWRVPVVSTADGLPWIGAHRNYPFHFFAIAFGAHGDGLAWHAAKAGLRQFNGEGATDDGVFGFLR
jgi:glycine/D-amino acid oxidase-like deaminating enzyme